MNLSLINDVFPQISTCMEQFGIANIHISKLNYEVWTSFTLDGLYVYYPLKQA